MEQICISKAVQHDAVSIAKTFALSYRHAYTGLLPYDYINHSIKRRSPIWWQKYIQDFANVWTIKRNNIVVAYITYGPTRHESIAHEGEIYGIYIRPEYQGNGFGKTLFEHAYIELHKIGLKGLSVFILAENELAIEFFKNRGGQVCGRSTTVHEEISSKKIAICWE